MAPPAGLNRQPRCTRPRHPKKNRPAIANERLSTNERGQVIYKFKQPFRDGTTHIVLEPTMQRLKHVFAIRRLIAQQSAETCPKCGGKLRVIACIEDPDVIATILEHIRTREAAETSQPRAPPLQLSPPANQDRLF